MATVSCLLLLRSIAGAGDGETLGQRYGATPLKTDIPTIGSRATDFTPSRLDYDGTAGGAGLYRLFFDNAPASRIAPRRPDWLAYPSVTIRCDGAVLAATPRTNGLWKAIGAALSFALEPLSPVFPEPCGTLLVVLGIGLASAFGIRRNR